MMDPQQFILGVAVCNAAKQTATTARAAKEMAATNKQLLEENKKLTAAVKEGNRAQKQADTGSSRSSTSSYDAGSYHRDREREEAERRKESELKATEPEAKASAYFCTFFALESCPEAIRNLVISFMTEGLSDQEKIKQSTSTWDQWKQRAMPRKTAKFFNKLIHQLIETTDVGYDFAFFVLAQPAAVHFQKAGWEFKPDHLISLLGELKPKAIAQWLAKLEFVLSEEDDLGAQQEECITSLRQYYRIGDQVDAARSILQANSNKAAEAATQTSMDAEYIKHLLGLYTEIVLLDGDGCTDLEREKMVELVLRRVNDFGAPLSYRRMLKKHPRGSGAGMTPEMAEQIVDTALTNGSVPAPTVSPAYGLLVPGQGPLGSFEVICSMPISRRYDESRIHYFESLYLFQLVLSDLEELATIDGAISEEQSNLISRLHGVGRSRGQWHLSNNIAGAIGFSAKATDWNIKDSGSPLGYFRRIHNMIAIGAMPTKICLKALNLHGFRFSAYRDRHNPPEVHFRTSSWSDGINYDWDKEHNIFLTFMAEWWNLPIEYNEEEGGYYYTTPIDSTASEAHKDFMSFLEEPFSYINNFGKKIRIQALAYLLMVLGFWDLDGITDEESAKIGELLLQWDETLNEESLPEFIKKCELSYEKDTREQNTEEVVRSGGFLRGNLNATEQMQFIAQMEELVAVDGPVAEQQ
jgi:hypothetical protein